MAHIPIPHCQVVVSRTEADTFPLTQALIYRVVSTCACACEGGRVIYDEGGSGDEREKDSIPKSGGIPNNDFSQNHNCGVSNLQQVINTNALEDVRGIG